MTERGRCIVCGWSGGHEVECHEPTHRERPTTLDPLITVASLEAAFAAAEALYAERRHNKQGVAIRALVYASAPLLIAPFRAEIDRLSKEAP